MSTKEHKAPSKRQSGRGHPARQAENLLGAFLQKKLSKKRMTQVEFARLLGVTRDIVRRLIHGSPSKLQPAFEERIYQVLELSETEQQEFQRILFSNSGFAAFARGHPEGEPGSSPSLLQIPAPSDLSLADASSEGFEAFIEKKRVGRAAKPAENELAKLLETHLSKTGMRRSQLAQMVGVAPATITRLFDGSTASLQRETKERICQALSFDVVARTQFYRLTAAERIPLISIHHYTGIDLDELEERLSENQTNFEKGHIEFVVLETQRWYELLKKRFPKKEKRAADLCWRFGMLQGNASEAWLAWEERSQKIIGIYDEIEAHVRSVFTIRDESARYLAQIQARLAPMYRELKRYQESLDYYTLALDTYARLEDTPENIRLRVELYYSRAHVYAIQGKKDLWQKDIGLARERAQKEKDSERRQQLDGLITYTEGEGYKRLATRGQGYDLLTSTLTDDLYHLVAEGLRCFELARIQMEGSKWIGHGILNRVAQAQCMALVSPKEAIKQANQLRAIALESYPSIVQKVDNTIRFAQKRLN